MTIRSMSPTQQHAYNKGYAAWNRKDIPNKDVLCPYPVHNALRQDWFNGLYDNQFSKYDHIPIIDNHASTAISQTKTKNMGKRGK